MPETGVDSIALSYVLLGPFMAVIRPVMAGCLAALVPETKKTQSAGSRAAAAAGPCCCEGDCGTKADPVPDPLAQWGSGLPAMLLMVLVGVPMYICATASTPVAAALLLAGVSPGTVLVFLLAGPATNMATLGVVRRELGHGVFYAYLGGIAAGSIALGLLTDGLAAYFAIDIQAQLAESREWMPAWLAVASAVILLAFVFRRLPRMLLRRNYT